MIVLGVDPGLTGAISAICSKRGMLECADLPVVRNGQATGSMQNWLSARDLSGMVKDWARWHKFAEDDVHAAIERPIAMPRLPSQTIASQFDTFGVVRAVLTLLVGAQRVSFINPAEWKRRFGLATDKADSRACALRIFPTAPLARVKDHNRAESLLIARFHLLNVNGPSVPREALEVV